MNGGIFPNPQLPEFHQRTDTLSPQCPSPFSEFRRGRFCEKMSLMSTFLDQYTAGDRVGYDSLKALVLLHGAYPIFRCVYQTDPHMEAF